MIRTFVKIVVPASMRKVLAMMTSQIVLCVVRASSHMLRVQITQHRVRIVIPVNSQPLKGMTQRRLVCLVPLESTLFTQERQKRARVCFAKQASTLRPRATGFVSRAKREPTPTQRGQSTAPLASTAGPRLDLASRFASPRLTVFPARTGAWLMEAALSASLDPFRQSTTRHRAPLARPANTLTFQDQCHAPHVVGLAFTRPASAKPRSSRTRATPAPATLTQSREA